MLPFLMQHYWREPYYCYHFESLSQCSLLLVPFFFLCFTELAVEQVLAISISVLPLSSQSFPEHRSCLVVPPSSVLIPGRSISHPLSQPSNRPKQSETLISDLESRTSSYRIRVKQPTQPLTRGISQLALSSLPDPVGHCVHFCSS